MCDLHVFLWNLIWLYAEVGCILLLIYSRYYRSIMCFLRSVQYTCFKRARHEMRNPIYRPWTFVPRIWFSIKMVISVWANQKLETSTIVLQLRVNILIMNTQLLINQFLYFQAASMMTESWLLLSSPARKTIVRHALIELINQLE